MTYEITVKDCGWFDSDWCWELRRVGDPERIASGPATFRWSARRAAKRAARRHAKGLSPIREVQPYSPRTYTYEVQA